MSFAFFFSFDSQFLVAIMLVEDIVHLIKKSSQFWNEKSVFFLFFQEVQQFVMLLQTAVYLFFKSSSSLCFCF